MTYEPQTLYRVQYANSFTQYNVKDGLVAPASYQRNNAAWVTAQRLEDHLDWYARPWLHTPFISFFDNLGDARKRAMFHERRGEDDVSILAFDISEFEGAWYPGTSYDDEEVDLDCLVSPDFEIGVFRVKPNSGRLGIDPKLLQRSEWLAIGNVPVKFLGFVDTF